MLTLEMSDFSCHDLLINTVDETIKSIREWQKPFYSMAEYHEGQKKAVGSPA